MNMKLLIVARHIYCDYVFTLIEKINRSGSTDIMEQLCSHSNQQKSVFPLSVLLYSIVSIILILHSTLKGAGYCIFFPCNPKNPCRSLCGQPNISWVFLSLCYSVLSADCLLFWELSRASLILSYYILI